MRERPILFSAPMVRAILGGTKTQTRRVVKPRKDLNVGCALAPHELAGEVNNGDFMNSAYGRPGDGLWVRETWAQPVAVDPGPTVYRADYPACVPVGYENIPPADAITWKPSIHMPRALSRILLEVTGVRVERLQDISEEDAIAEGIIPHVRGGWHWHKHDPNSCDDWHQFGFKSAASAYQDLWEQINGAGSWEANPWVWVVEFRAWKRHPLPHDRARTPCPQVRELWQIYPLGASKGLAEDTQQSGNEGATATQSDFVMQRSTHDGLPISQK